MNWKYDKTYHTIWPFRNNITAPNIGLLHYGTGHWEATVAHTMGTIAYTICIWQFNSRNKTKSSLFLISRLCIRYVWLRFWLIGIWKYTHTVLKNISYIFGSVITQTTYPTPLSLILAFSLARLPTSVFPVEQKCVIMPERAASALRFHK